MIGGGSAWEGARRRGAAQLAPLYRWSRLGDAHSMQRLCKHVRHGRVGFALMVVGSALGLVLRRRRGCGVAVKVVGFNRYGASGVVRERIAAKVRISVCLQLIMARGAVAARMSALTAAQCTRQGCGQGCGMGKARCSVAMVLYCLLQGKRRTKGFVRVLLFACLGVVAMTKEAMLARC
jgi:hypothetical protein